MFPMEQIAGDYHKQQIIISWKDQASRGVAKKQLAST
jgi:hypothetical protein